MFCISIVVLLENRHIGTRGTHGPYSCCSASFPHCASEQRGAPACRHAARSGGVPPHRARHGSRVSASRRDVCARRRGGARPRRAAAGCVEAGPDAARSHGRALERRGRCGAGRLHPCRPCAIQVLRDGRRPRVGQEGARREREPRRVRHRMARCPLQRHQPRLPRLPARVEYPGDTHAGRLKPCPRLLSRVVPRSDGAREARAGG